ncbi:hypothetical protein DPMN_029597 [Dreissena polymorpha]|uniref:Ion transport domain-containing protein n=1 Tax=Dreissena polymorpha TaxID=45954 RepID=A0A9D4RHA5_DREPO|nr:hypothetical protein DPMN_029597 [Dreissena polymorpha]
MPLWKFTTKNGPCKPKTLCCKKHKKQKESHIEPELEMTMKGPEQEPGMKEQKREPERRKMDFYLKKFPSSKPQLYPVGIFRKNQEGIIRFTDAIYHLYTAPCSVYTFNLLSYVIFVIYFSYFIIVDLNEEASFMEYTLWGWVLTMFFEETRECVKMCQCDGLMGRIQYWFGSQWNKFDAILYFFFITTIATRYSLSGNNFQYVRFLYSLNVALYSMRFLQAFLVAEKLGPKLIMLKKMMFDLFIFAGIFIVFFVTFCVMYQANLYPNSPNSRTFIWDKFWHTPFWQIFGELFVDEIGRGPLSANCTTDESVWRPQGGTNRCPTGTYMVAFIGAIYMILTHIVLNNLLIAMFSHTFANVQEKSGHIWKYYCYGIVREYYTRPVLCPPLIILVHIYRTLRYVRFRCGDCVYDNEFRLKDKEGFYSKHLLKFADAAAKRCIKQNKNAQTQEF